MAERAVVLGLGLALALASCGGDGGASGADALDTGGVDDAPSVDTDDPDVAALDADDPDVAALDTGAARPLRVDGRAAYMAHVPEHQEVTLYRDVPLDAVTVNLDPGLVLEQLELRETPAGRVIERLLTEPVPPRALGGGVWDERVDAAVRDLVASRALGPLRRFYAASRAMELVALVLDHVARAEPRQRRPYRLTGEDRERIDAARVILERELEEPPTTAELAARCGLSASRLKWGFREQHGTSLFAYLRRARMHQAGELLRRGASVLEAAVAVGYDNPSHFARAFRREMGVNPSAWKPGA